MVNGEKGGVLGEVWEIIVHIVLLKKHLNHCEPFSNTAYPMSQLLARINHERSQSFTEATQSFYTFRI